MADDNKIELPDNLKKLASGIRDRKLNTPVSFLFESHIPAFSILYSIFLCTEPFIIPFVSGSTRSVMHTLYQNPEMKELFLSELDTNKEH